MRQLSYLIGVWWWQVVCGMVDPDPRVSGGGLRTLVAAGIAVACVGGAEEQACKDLNKVFLSRVLAEKEATEN
jgi:diaminohydroxyphosphoribosylaminopyrimidine deaminase/5-amino-6-(5-phosphoribosylamino)uracil reductase